MTVSVTQGIATRETEFGYKNSVDFFVFWPGIIVLFPTSARKANVIPPSQSRTIQKSGARGNTYDTNAVFDFKHVLQFNDARLIFNFAICSTVFFKSSALNDG